MHVTGIIVKPFLIHISVLGKYYFPLSELLFDILKWRKHQEKEIYRMMILFLEKYIIWNKT